MANRLHKSWEKKLSFLVVLFCLLSNYFLQGTILRQHGKQKCSVKDIGVEDGKDSNGFLAAQQLHRMGLIAAQGHDRGKKRYFKTRISYYQGSGNMSTFQLEANEAMMKCRIVLSGDIHMNPGPIKNPCVACKRPVASAHRFVKCSECNSICHIGVRCGNVLITEYHRILQDSSIIWKCQSCRALEPNAQINRSETITQEQYIFRTLQSYFNKGKSVLTTAQINVNGILTCTKLEEIKIILLHANIDILGITETKLNKTVEDKDLEITGYKFLRKDREENNGGGCMMYYKEDLNITEKKQSKDHNNIEAIWADAVMHSQKVSIAVVYRPPDNRIF